MIARYTRPQMGRIWSDASKYSKWLEVEVAFESNVDWTDEQQSAHADAHGDHRRLQLGVDHDRFDLRPAEVDSGAGRFI